jgi:hypothetical protein
VLRCSTAHDGRPLLLRVDPDTGDAPLIVRRRLHDHAADVG